MFTTTYTRVQHLQELNRQLNTKYNGRLTREGAEIEKLAQENINNLKAKQIDNVSKREEKILSLEIRASLYEKEKEIYFIDKQECRGGYARYIYGNKTTGEIWETIKPDTQYKRQD